MKKTFLTAEWRKLAMANYSIDADILKPYLPCVLKFIISLFAVGLFH